MKSEQSVFKKLITYNLPIAILPFLMVLVLFFVYTCSNIKGDEYQNIKDIAEGYVREVDILKNKAVEKTEYIIKNTEITELLESKPTELVDKMQILKKIENYVQIINADTLKTIMIYTDNPHLQKSNFTNQLENLKGKEEIINNLSASDYLYFEDELTFDEETGKECIMLYRKVISDTDTVIAVKVFMPESDSITLMTDKTVPKDNHSLVSAQISPRIYAVTRLDPERLKSQYLRYGSVFFLIALMFCAVILFASRAINNKTTNSISSFIHSLSKKDLLMMDEEITPYGSDSVELKIIKKALGELVTRVNESKDAQYKAELNKKRLEFDLLQSKINPHVLYNSLATASLRAFKNDDRKTFELIRTLTSYYRLVLSKGKVFTTLADELELIKSFISLNEISHGQKYNFTENIEPELLNEKFLHLTLQPFIENSIVHGLAGRKQECEINLTAVRDGKNMVIKIRDNGYGIEPQKLIELQNLSQTEGSYGIKNTYDRLSLYYDNNCSINFESEFEKYTEVTITIPTGKTG